jgi:phosphoglycolate phosphatase-like HAD superfamily hydrolase
MSLRLVVYDLDGTLVDSRRDLVTAVNRTLGRLGLRPPVAPLDGPNVEARLRGRAMLRRALLEARR